MGAGMTYRVRSGRQRRMKLQRRLKWWAGVCRGARELAESIGVEYSPIGLASKEDREWIEGLARYVGK